VAGGRLLTRSTGKPPSDLRLAWRFETLTVSPVEAAKVQHRALAADGMPTTP